MNVNHLEIGRVGRNRLGVAGVLAACAGMACATCVLAQPATFFIDGMPSFDQRRQVTASVEGLPNNGAMYCGPTATCNMLAYLANRGAPALFSGPKFWQSQSHYDLVTSKIDLFGDWQGTDPFDGGGNQLGLSHWLNTFDDRFVIVTKGNITPGNLSVLAWFGGVTTIWHGWYTVDGGGTYTRNGGHCITLVGVDNAWTNGSQMLRWMDPARDNQANTTQSVFTPVSSAVQAHTANFRWSTTDPYQIATRYYLQMYAPGASFVESYVGLIPLFCLTAEQAEPFKIKFVFLPGLLAPAIQSITIPNGAALRNIVPAASGIESYYVAAPTATSPARAYVLNPATGISTMMTGLTAPSRVACGRKGEVYVADGSFVRVFNPEGASAVPPQQPQPLQSVDTRNGIDAIAVGDVNDVPGDDNIFAFDFSQRELTVYSRPSNAPPGAPLNALPIIYYFGPGPVFSGECSMAVHPADGSLWVTSTGSPAIYKYILPTNPGTPITPVETVAASSPRSLNVDQRGHLMYLNGDRLIELKKTTSGQWIQETQNPRFPGFSGSQTLSVARSRFEMQDWERSGRSWRNVLPPPTGAVPVYCDANCDGSTASPVLTPNDFQCFLDRYAANSLYANCDGSTGTPMLTPNDFQCYLNRYAAGCP